ncbi:MAG: protein translocase subunit SecF [Magnetospiraceae bacterium]
MRGLRLLPQQPNLDFIGKRKIFFAFSTLLVLGALLLYAMQGLNLGIDFKGGILIEIKTDGPADIAKLRSDVGSLGIGDVSLQEFGAVDEVLIRVQRQDGGEEAQQEAITQVRAVLGGDVEYRRIEAVGPAVSAELFEAGLYAVTFALLAMMAYIWFRFEWQFGLGAVIALFHDVISTVGLFSVLQMEFNLSTVAAILTIAGYSINDTVVVFDRVRENLRRYKKMPLPEVFNKSINETLSRTLMTSLTTLIALLALYILGGEVIRGFSFAMIWGILIGTYSSICLAVPLMLYLKIQRRSGSEQATEADSAEKTA